MKFIILLLCAVFVLSTPATAQKRFSSLGDATVAGAPSCPKTHCAETSAAQTRTVSTGLAKAIQDALYNMEPVDGGYRARNRAQQLDAEFAGTSTKVTTIDGTLELSLLDYGSPQEIQSNGVRLERKYRGLREQFLNDTAGLEQEFIVEARPVHFLIRLATGGGWSVSGDAAKMKFTRGKSVLEYSALKVWDAKGTMLAANMRLVGDVIQIEVNDAQAVYPVTVDPLFNQPLIQAVLTDASANDFGYSLSLSADGNAALIGAVGTAIGGIRNVGSAYVFVRNGASWSLQATLADPNPGTVAGGVQDGFGSSVSISADGNIAVVGAPNQPNGEITPGAVYVFSRSSGPVLQAGITSGASVFPPQDGPTWNQTAVIEGSEDGSSFGAFVALSADGATTIIGAPIFGEAFIYSGPVQTSIGPIWVRQASLSSATSDQFSNFGAAVAISGDGSIALVGASTDDLVYVFTRSSGWAVQQFLTPHTEQRIAFGSSVALTAAGTIALIAAPEENDFTGAAYAYTNDGTTWTLQARLSAPATGAGASTGLDQFGYSESLSPDGSTALVGAVSKTIGSNARQGAAYSFTRSGNSWALAHFLTAPTSGPNAGATDDHFGNSVALSNQGQTALIGAFSKTIGTNGQQGVAYVVIPSPLAVVIGTLTNLINNSNLPAPAQTALLNTVQRLSLLESSSDAQPGVAALQFLIGRVKQMQSLKLITGPQADQLLGVANQAITDLVSQ